MEFVTFCGPVIGKKSRGCEPRLSVYTRNAGPRDRHSIPNLLRELVNPDTVRCSDAVVDFASFVFSERKNGHLACLDFLVAADLAG